ncbi:hypothetical protein LAV84_06755 [Rhizobium sp. VS19-DR104.2]|uniref:hypothetical protein n=1 Tax=unclassified Rhizobium TaxID=2613769 RepID=UPI001CC436FC|nr:MULTISPECIES: hypothetical protein [unclassified Rhizobium]MBZ5760246.1 hypothetical protein [Rhizobium sp. VS19-DR96]MBZ5766910.1 hypothetical protein [Rhizobium sp. VS19-DR129.2]MBZ5773097.1 hypothetical protein [Rhizobium sp. VS19-DRK62.2]MBZ5784081.1 hypothetical protein [Rhizobium sp. VS19-DR121]MBZ5802441.1 hypothetical protein [Rhizobium sp. VS19-DR181]
MIATATADTIAALENRLGQEKRNYLRRLGWKQTCNTPGSFWMWTRDFADVDEKSRANHPPKASPFAPYGFITAETEMAVQMSIRVLEPAGSDDDGD